MVLSLTRNPVQLATPAAYERHLLNRFSFGCTPELATEAAAAGGARAWFEQQLVPEAVPDSFADGLLAWWPDLSKTARQLQAGSDAGTLKSLDVSANLCSWSLMRRAYSKRQLFEVMAAFWLDHLHVTVHDGGTWAVRREHDTIMRQHALGRFEDMLVAGVLGRAIGCYLDNSKSTARRLNENLGREVLELHTVGREAAYTERDVLNAARILTGYRVDRAKTWDAWYAPSDHWVGPVQVLGFSHPNADPDGRPVAEALLRYLARHPATAQRIALKLCRRFVADTPSQAVVDVVAQAYLDSGSDISTMLRALVNHPDFAAAVGTKTRTPIEDCVATWRALGMQPVKPTRSTDFAAYCVIQTGSLGQRPFDWPRPDGPPDTADPWSSVSRLLASWNVHYGMAGRYQPTTGVTFRTPESWLPPLPASVVDIVDHVCRQLLCRPADARLVSVVAQRIALSADTQILVFDDLRSWRLQRLLAAVLDTPEHMTR
ncbi:MAG: DUF1800 domain-containing protein [Nocardioidaceae bacterium]|nr:DUF1800 domain-containing protein [Nocardioidaceae bacterium]